MHDTCTIHRIRILITNVPKFDNKSTVTRAEEATKPESYTVELDVAEVAVVSHIRGMRSGSYLGGQRGRQRPREEEGRGGQLVEWIERDESVAAILVEVHAQVRGW